MPEMPEVETIRRDLLKKIIGSPITEVGIIDSKVWQSSLAWSILSEAKFSDVERIGKLLIFVLDGRQLFLLIHLKMTGQLIYENSGCLVAGGHSLDFASDGIGGSLPNKYTRAFLVFENGAKLFFNDIRRFGYWKLVGSEELLAIKARYGLEILNNDWQLGNFASLLEKSKTNIKSALLNQSKIAGIGNIYADESLFRAGIKPDRKANSLKKIEVKKLFSAIRDIMLLAIEYRGTTFNNYVDSDGHKGNFVSFLQVYGRGGQACPVCGRELAKKRTAGRGTVFCNYCQK